MSDKIGGPAFPLSSELVRTMISACTDLPKEKGAALAEKIAEISAGMTLRDYFAAKAMEVLMQADFKSGGKTGLEVVANGSYLMADAMLKARNE